MSAGLCLADVDKEADVMIANLSADQLAGLDLQCACGRRHRVPIDHIITGAGALERLPEAVAAYAGCRTLLVSDSHIWPLAGERVKGLLERAGLTVETYVFSRREHYVTDEAAIGELLVRLPQDAGLIVALGSGTMNDISRVVSARCRLPYIVVGTAPSMDGYASSTSAVICAGEKLSVPLCAPRGIVIDTDLLITAPDEMLSAGIGDVLGKHVTLADWRLAAREGRDHFCGEISDLIEAACRRCQAGVYGVLERRPEALKDMSDTLIMAGAAISMFGTSRPCAGSEHQLAHAWEMDGLRAGRSGLHGNYVGLGTVAAILLYCEAADEVDLPGLGYVLPEPEAIREIMDRAGGWATKERLGVDRESFLKAFVHSARTNPRYTILTWLDEHGCLRDCAHRVTGIIYGQRFTV